MAMREFLNLSGIPFTKEGIYATNNQFQKAGPKGFIHFKVLQNDKLYLPVDLPGVPDNCVRHRVDNVRKNLCCSPAKLPTATREKGFESTLDPPVWDVTAARSLAWMTR
ncbi:hypothetical protein HA466_0221770 [Hirschfeldia incana]|nr:hypothetical protein HA466_0221770 [Hirschfeldia incana]